MKSLKLRVVCCIFFATAVLSVGCGDNVCTYYEDPFDPDGGLMLDAWPKWSPADTAIIAYTHFSRDWEELMEYGEFSVWTVDIVTGQKEHITEGAVHDWSPDGRQVLVWRSGGQMWLVNVATGVEELLPVRGQEADFSPCGERIAFYGGLDSTGTWVLDLNSMTAGWLSAWGGADWSPDGSLLLCDSLVVIDESGIRVGKIEIDYSYGGPSYARWSPEGNRIGYGAYCEPREERDNDAGIWIVNTDGTGQRLVTCPGAVVSWSPDGNRLAYVARLSDGQPSFIWVVSSDGTGKRQVTFP